MDDIIEIALAYKRKNLPLPSDIRWRLTNEQRQQIASILRRDEWFLEDTIALKKTAIYYGIPKYGHKECYRQAGGLFLVEQANRSEPDIEKKYCSACDKPLIPRSK